MFGGGDTVVPPKEPAANKKENSFFKSEYKRNFDEFTKKKIYATLATNMGNEIGIG